jgi:L-lactate dehydrogenase complex protein LldF
MTTEEIGLTPYLENKGFEVVETDLGEYIVQIAGQMPSHITAPALHLSRQDVGKIFAEKLGVEYKEDPVELIGIARQILREKFLKADIGITGVNFAVAETGTPLMVENEGNGRLVSAIPQVQISVMGIEKVVATWEDLMILLELLPRSATGQRITGSVIFFNGRLPDAEGPREMHLVVLDNGRTKALADPELRSVLRCIRCGACLNVCPVYRHTGGHAYGWVYPGPIGAVLAPIFLSLEQTADHPFASTLCGACSEICPVKIELHHHLLTLRGRVAATGESWDKGRLLMASYEWLMDRPELYRLLAGIPRFLLHNLLGGRWKPNLLGWGASREAPEMAARSFSEQFRQEFEGGREAGK